MSRIMQNKMSRFIYRLLRRYFVVRRSLEKPASISSIAQINSLARGEIVIAYIFIMVFGNRIESSPASR